MTSVEIGKVFEEKAKVILESNGYTVKRWLSKEDWSAPCDMLVEKEGEEMYCEVRGVTGKYGNVHFSAQKIARLTVLTEQKPVILFLLRGGKHRIVSLEDLPKEPYVVYPQHPLEPTILFKAELTKEERKKVRIAKIKMDAKSNVDCLLKLVDAYNELRRIKGEDTDDYL